MMAVAAMGAGAKAGPYAATIPHLAFATFQAMFAGIAVALASGAMFERIELPVHLVFAALWSLLAGNPALLLPQALGVVVTIAAA